MGGGRAEVERNGPTGQRREGAKGEVQVGTRKGWVRRRGMGRLRS